MFWKQQTGFIKVIHMKKPESRLNMFCVDSKSSDVKIMSKGKCIKKKLPQDKVKYWIVAFCCCFLLIVFSAVLSLYASTTKNITDISRIPPKKPIQTENAVGEINFIYEGKATRYTWQEHNFSIKLQADSFPYIIHPVQIEVSAFFGDPYILPANVRPASAFFQVKCNCKSYKEILMTIEHYAVDTSNLKFVVSSNKTPPYFFEILDDGKFYHKFGILNRTQFSKFGIVSENEDSYWKRIKNVFYSQTKSAYHYYIAMYSSLNEDLTWNVNIYITKESGSHRTELEKITKKLNMKLNTHTSVTVENDLKKFEIDISLFPEEIKSGWDCLSRRPIIIDRGRIDETLGIPASASFKIRLIETEHSSNFVHNYSIANVRQDNDLILTLTIPRNTPCIQDPHQSLSSDDYRISFVSDHYSARSYVTASQEDLLLFSNKPITSVEDTSLFDALNEIGDWKSLCTSLGVNRVIIENLKYSNLEGYQKRRDCLAKYIDSGRADWGKVVTVVAKFPFNNINLSCNIASKHLKIEKGECHAMFKK